MGPTVGRDLYYLVLVKFHRRYYELIKQWFPQLASPLIIGLKPPYVKIISIVPVETDEMADDDDSSSSSSEVKHDDVFRDKDCRNKFAEHQKQHERESKDFEEKQHDERESKDLEEKQHDEGERGELIIAPELPKMTIKDLSEGSPSKMRNINFFKQQRQFIPPASLSGTGSSSRTSKAASKGLVTSNYDPNISNSVYVNGMKSCCFDSENDVPNCKDDVDIEIEKILRQAGALGSRDLDDCGVYHCREGCYKPSHINAIMGILKPRRREILHCVLLLTATVVAKITYQAAISLPGGTLREGYAYNSVANGTLQLKNGDLIIVNRRSFILFNSTGFVASVAVIIFLLHEFPLKPWPQISVLTLFASYMCLIMATSPREAFLLLFLAIPFILLAAAGKLHGFATQRGPPN